MSVSQVAANMALVTTATRGEEGPCDPLADFERDLRDGLVAGLPLRAGELQSISSRSTEQLVVDHLTWSSRGIPRRGRAVHLSDAVRHGDVFHDPAVGLGLGQVLQRARTGQDLAPHLSRQTRFAYAWRRRPNQPLRLGLDRLLHAWGIHHLHLGTSMEADGFVGRMGSVLMAVVRPDDFYAVDVVTHDESDPLWAVNLDLLSAIARNWPAADLIHQVHGAVGLVGPDRTAADHLALRRAGISSFVALDGRVFLPGMLNLDGSPLLFGERADAVVAEVRRLQEMVHTGGGSWFRALVATNTAHDGSGPARWQLTTDAGYVVLEEEFSGLRASFPYLSLTP